MKTDDFVLEKALWSQSDFEVMGWHDALIHGISFSNQPDVSGSSMLFDIDYIFQWLLNEPSQSFSFQVAPCTLVFYEVADLKIDISFGHELSTELEIADLYLEAEHHLTDTYKTYSWRIETHRGEITFRAVGFEQYVRRHPQYIESQSFELTERGGINFDKIACL